MAAGGRAEHLKSTRLKANPVGSIPSSPTSLRAASAATGAFPAVELGHGEPIVFVHGSFDCAEETFPDQRELANQYRVVLVDRRGYGDSPPAVRFEFDTQVGDLIAVLGSGAQLVGHSYGGVQQGRVNQGRGGGGLGGSS